MKKKFKNGDIYFQKNTFNIFDINSYLSPIIYFGINFWRYMLHKPKCPVHHCGIIFKENNTWFIYESKSKGIEKNKLDDKFKNKSITTIKFKRYKLNNEQKKLIKIKCDEYVGNIKYDIGSIFLHFFRQLFNKKVDLSTNPNKYKNKKMNCCEFIGEVLFVSDIKFNTNIKSLDPVDLYFDCRSKVIDIYNK